ncbi:uncharacterized protein TRUGW13939_06799 [Talaromyces rugulosus]|uniref:Uncharacterized protein n=1 Tax=Talaromyces rugulosus TaxID=121627 RepID=A0A7H8QZV8_TALRU|nr:uncharacterized protein TRUGW13939_06799 [Talaromyces rugulosus]QKX59659.1 hypothetical protein TRUGW13939_06799 [Talaromyces rugulosus]
MQSRQTRQTTQTNEIRNVNTNATSLVLRSFLSHFLRSLQPLHQGLLCRAPAAVLRLDLNLTLATAVPILDPASWRTARALPARSPAAAAASRPCLRRRASPSRLPLPRITGLRFLAPYFPIGLECTCAFVLRVKPRSVPWLVGFGLGLFLLCVASCLRIDSLELVQDAYIDYKLRDSDCRAFLTHDFVESGGALDTPNPFEHAVPILSELRAVHDDMTHGLSPEVTWTQR